MPTRSVTENRTAAIFANSSSVPVGVASKNAAQQIIRPKRDVRNVLVIALSKYPALLG